MKNRFRTLTIASRLKLIVGGFFVISIITGALSLITLSRLKVNGPIYAGVVQQKDILADILPPPLYLLETYMAAIRMVGDPDPSAMKECVAQIEQLKKDFETRTTFWTGELADSPIRTLLIEESHKPAIELFRIIEQELIPAMLKGDKTAASAIAYGKLESQYDEHRKVIDRAVALATKNSQTIESEAAKEILLKTTVLLSTLGAGLLLVAVFSFMMARSLIATVRTTAEELAKGSKEVDISAIQFLATSQTLADGANQQAASLEETSASLEEMTSMTRCNSDHSNKAHEIAKKTCDAAEEGAINMKEMSLAMDGIKATSGEIAKIVKTIDEIAFQTNILALNAAVEAARAGEAGMGFAVVAEEVRSLSQRCAQAAKETSEKIESAIHSINKGVDISTKVGQVLGEIVVSARQVDELATSVAQASNEQSQGVSQVNMAVSQMDKVTQGNAANAEETATAASELVGQAESMMDSVDGLLALVGKRAKSRKDLSNGKPHDNNEPNIPARPSSSPSKTYAERGKSMTISLSSRNQTPFH